jgi:epidermal growth factor receptor substrate 15
MDDLLGDADPEVSKKLTNETTELANLSNQIGSLTKQTQELNVKRVSAETDLSTLNSQKQHIETQLAQLRAAYEKEAVQVRRVEEQLAASRAGTTKATQEFQRIEADYNELQYKRQEVASQLEADKRENENLKERMNAINSENRQLREEVERLQSQARREKGLVDVNRRQVEKSEQEREKLKSGVEEANRSTVASPAPPASPTLSQGSVSTNPFYRKSPPVTDNAFSPSFTHSKQSAPSMDDVFGPSFSSTPPPTSFAHKALAEATSSGTEGGRSTPPTSRPSSSIQGSPVPAEAPPLAASSQITSASLPLPFYRTDSVTSSTQVQPSASVRDDGDVSKAETPTNWTGITAAELSGKEDRRSSFGSALERRNESPFTPLERNTTGTTSGGDENKPRFEKTDTLHSFGNALPGAFPVVEGNAPIKPTPTGESTMSNRSRQSNASRSAFGNDPFSLNKDETRSNSSKQDFEEAFKGFRAVEHHTGGSGSVTQSKFNDEFPPIEEIPQDSDSDSEVGFEDNFIPANPAQTRAALNTAKSDDPHTETTQPSGQPPTASVQQATLPFSTDPKAALPFSTDPVSHDAPAAVTSKDRFDDDAFGDLAEAKEADDKNADNDFGTSSGFDDFNPVFDNPTTSHKNQPGQAISDGDDFAKFSFNIDVPTAQSGSETGSSAHQTAKRASPQDWDAIFAGFGEQPMAQSSSQDKVPAGANDAPDQSGTDPGEGGVSLKSSHDPTTLAPASAPEGAEVGEARGKEAGNDDEKVTKLTGMGFDRVSSVKALEKNGWNLDLVRLPWPLIGITVH